jgi:predicted transcriptional regulator
MSIETREYRKQQLVAIMRALLETVLESGEQGAPSGSLYLACQQFGINLEAYQAIMEILVKQGLVTHSNHCYFPRAK